MKRWMVSTKSRLHKKIMILLVNTMKMLQFSTLLVQVMLNKVRDSAITRNVHKISPISNSKIR